MKSLMKCRLMSTKREGMEDLLDYIENETDFYKAPASTKYHSNCKNGLLMHSHYVVESLLKKNKKEIKSFMQQLVDLTNENIELIQKEYDN